MAVLAECPTCHCKQSAKNKVCKCGADLDKLKRQKERVKYWIDFRVNGKSRREQVGFSIEEARDADGKRRVQKRENRIFDILPEAKMTLTELAEWYLDLEKVKALKSYWRIELCLNRFNAEFGDFVVSQIKPADIENYQAKRKAEGKADATVDQETGAAKTMIAKAFENDLVGGDTLRTFKSVRKLLKRNSNARDKILTFEQFNCLMGHLPAHTKQILAAAFYTGMRLGEILNLTWDKVDMKNRVIRLEAGDTKDNEAREIPVLEPLYGILSEIPRPLHHNYVFVYQDKPLRDIRNGLRAACKKAGITYGRFEKDGFVFHDLRHSFNTYMRKAGVQQSLIMEITGHSTREMFDRYNTVDMDDRQKAMGQLQEYLANVDQSLDQVASQEVKIR